MSAPLPWAVSQLNPFESVKEPEGALYDWHQDLILAVFPNIPFAMMLNAKNIKALLTDNVDEHASHYVLFTTHGTLLGHDQPTNMNVTTKFGAFGGAIWRVHNAEIAISGQPSATSGVGSVKTLKTVIKHDGSGLKSMIVQMDGVVSAVTEVLPKGRQERLLIAAQLEVESFAGERDEVAARIAGLERGKGREDGREDGNAKRGDAKSGGRAGGVAEEGDVQPTNLENEGETASLSTDPKGKKVEYEANSGDSDQGSEENPSKTRILELKAEGMAEALAEDLPNFRMPDSFY